LIIYNSINIVERVKYFGDLVAVNTFTGRIMQIEWATDTDPKEKGMT